MVKRFTKPWMTLVKLVKLQGDFEGQAFAFMSDSFGIVVGSMLGISPLTAFIESASGVREGAKTGKFFYFFYSISWIRSSQTGYFHGSWIGMTRELCCCHENTMTAAQ